MLMISDPGGSDPIKKEIYSGNKAGAEVAGILKKSYGFFVEVGAGEGMEKSLTGDLEKTGWQGILIEQDIVKCGHCIINRPASAVLNHKCVSQDFANHSSQRNSSGEKSFSSPEKGSLRTLSSILKEFDIGSIDLLVINTPDSFADILNGLDLSVSAPEYILIKESPGNKSENRLNSLGYDVVNTMKGLSFYRYVLYRNRSNLIKACEIRSVETLQANLGGKTQAAANGYDVIDRLSQKIADIVKSEISRFLKEERGIR